MKYVVIVWQNPKALPFQVVGPFESEADAKVWASDHHVYDMRMVTVLTPG